MILPDELNSEVMDILGRPCFSVASIARLLDQIGLYKVDRRAESEQAAALHWMLTLYSKHGEDWMKEANRILTEGKAAIDAGKMKEPCPGP